MSQVYDDPKTMGGKIFVKKDNNKDCTEILNTISNIDIDQNINITLEEPKKISFKYGNTPGNYINHINELEQEKKNGKDNNNSQLNPNEKSSKYFNIDEIENNKNKIKEINIKIEKIFDLEEKNEYYKKFNDNKSKLYKI